MKRYLSVILLAAAPMAYGQALKLEVFDRLKDKAKEAVDLNLPKDLIGVAAGVLGNGGGDAGKAKKLAAGLNSVLVKSLEFDKPGVYTDNDVKNLIAELGTPGWKLVISANEKNEKSRIWFKSSENGEFGGIRIMSAEGKELSVIEILGKVNLEDLKDLGGLGIPNLNINVEHTGQPAKKNEE